MDLNKDASKMFIMLTLGNVAVWIWITMPSKCIIFARVSLQQGTLFTARQLSAHMTRARFPLPHLQRPIRDVRPSAGPEECLKGKLASLKRKLLDESSFIDQPLMDTWPSI